MKKNELKNALLSSINAQNISQLNDTLRDVRIDIVSMLRDRNITAGREIVSDAKAVLPLILSEVDSNNTSYLIGKYVGAVDILDEILNVELVEDEKIQKVMDDVRSEDIPHINEIVYCIFHNPGIRHGKLAKMVGISAGSLTPLMVKIEESGLIMFSRPGKYKYYYLTESGENYYNNKRAESKENMDLDYILENLKILLSHAKNRDEVLRHIMDRLLTPGYKASGFEWIKKDDKHYKVQNSDYNKALNLSFIHSNQIINVPSNNLNFHDFTDEPLIEINGFSSFPKSLWFTAIMKNKKEIG